MSRIKVTSIEFDGADGKKYVSSYEFGNRKEAEEWIRKQYLTDYCDHYDIPEDEFNEDDYEDIYFTHGRAEYSVGDSEFLFLIAEHVDPLNAIESFMYYMWNKFGEDECLNHIHWSVDPHHFWRKWSDAYDRHGGPDGAIAPFFGQLDGYNRQSLVDRALQMYDGKKDR